MSEERVTLLVAAEAREFTGLMENVEDFERLHWPVQFARRVEYRGNVAVLVAHGPGPELAAQAVRVAAERERPAAVVSTGFCGGLDPALQPSDIFVAREVMGVGPAILPPLPNGRGSEGSRASFGDAHTLAGTRSFGGAGTFGDTQSFDNTRSFPSRDRQGAVAIGALISSNRVAVTAAEKTELRKTGGDAVEMEAAGVAREAQRLSLPFYCVRVVTDTAGESLPLDFNRMRDQEGRFSRMRIVAAGLRNPGTIFPKLMKLNERCKCASIALGEFLANCRF